VVSDAVKKRFTVWVAQWSSKCNYSGSYGIWQYSSKGKVNGISGNVDMDYSYIDFPSAIRNGGFNGYGKSAAVQHHDDRKEVCGRDCSRGHRR
jgi:lysozyme